MGNLDNNPEVKFLDGVKFVAFSLTTDGHYYCESTGNRIEYTDFHNVICYTGIANFVHKAIQRGMKVLISGSIRTIIEKDREGRIHYSKKVIADSVQSVGKNLITDYRIIFYDANGFQVCIGSV